MWHNFETTVPLCEHLRMPKAASEEMSWPFSLHSRTSMQKRDISHLAKLNFYAKISSLLSRCLEYKVYDSPRFELFALELLSKSYLT